MRAAELMVKKYGATIEAVFIRRAQPVDKTPGFDEEVGREKHLAQWRAQRIFFFDTYVGAAVQVNIINISFFLLNFMTEFSDNLMMIFLFLLLQALELDLIKPEGLFRVVRSSQQMFLDLEKPTTLEEWRKTERRRNLINRDTRTARQLLRARAVEAKGWSTKK